MSTTKKSTSVKKTVTAKSSTKKNVQRETTKVIAFNGKKRVKTFPSIAEAARWVQSNNPRITSNTQTVAASICSTSLGRESRKDGGTRHVAYGYSWVRG